MYDHKKQALLLVSLRCAEFYNVTFQICCKKNWVITFCFSKITAAVDELESNWYSYTYLHPNYFWDKQKLCMQWLSYFLIQQNPKAQFYVVLHMYYVTFHLGHSVAGNHAAYQESSLAISIFFVFLGQVVPGSNWA